MEIISGLNYLRTKDILFTYIIIHAKVFTVKVISVIFMTDQVDKVYYYTFHFIVTTTIYIIGRFLQTKYCQIIAISGLSIVPNSYQKNVNYLTFGSGTTDKLEII